MKRIFFNAALAITIRLRFFEPVFYRLCLRFDGGEYNSFYLRRYFKAVYKMDVGLYTYGCFKRSVNFGGMSLSFGRYCSVANDVIYLGANHPMECFSMSPIFYRG